MKRELAALARFRFSRAKETFRDAVLLLEEGSLNSATNRFYYAAFYAARGLLTLKELDSSKHSGVISLFGQYFVKPGTISADVAKVLRRSFEKRLDTDYEDFSVVEPDEVKQMKESVQHFISECEQVLAQLVGQRKASRPKGKPSARRPSPKS